MKKLDYTFSMLITIILSAVGTFFGTLHYLQSEGLMDSLASQAAKKKQEPVSKVVEKVKPQEPRPVGIGKLGSLAIELLHADRAINALGFYLDSGNQYKRKLNAINSQYEIVRKSVDELTNVYPKQASAIKVSHIQMQQQRVLALAEIDRLVQLQVHLKKINEAMPKAFSLSKKLADLLATQSSDAKLVKLATYQLILLERIENSLNRALRFNLQIKHPARLLERAQRDLAVFVTVVEGFTNGNATQGINPLKDQESKKLLAELNQYIPMFEFNLKPIVDNRLRIASTRKSIRQYNQSSKKLRELILELDR